MLETIQGGKDKQLMAATMVLMAVGLLMVYTSSAGLGAVRYQGDLYYYFRNQAMRVVLAFTAMVVAMNIDYHKLQKMAPWLLLASYGALVAVVLPGIGKEVRGARSWSGFIPVQPSELARLAMVLYLSVFLTKRANVHSFRKCILPCFVFILGAAGLVLLQPDLGSAVVIVLIGLVVVYAAGARLLHLSSILGFGGVAAGVCMLKNPYQIARILGYFGQGARYQVNQSLIALGTGGLVGKGLGGSMQKYLFLPDPHTDFVFSIYGEETGFIGTLLLVSLFVFLLLRGLKIASNAPDRFGLLLATGMVASIGVFFAFNIGVVTGLLPTTGLPLPFISYGGSALLVNAVCVGVLLNISGHRSSEGVSVGGSRWMRHTARLTE
jgi:cell division protein FtsW